MRDTYVFPAVFTHNKNGYAVEFTELPGCLSCADPEVEAISCAR
ncbi:MULTISPECIES: hypothetical protein [Synergistales]|nr:hypothetical protein [Aminithiophilus ramosus]